MTQAGEPIGRVAMIKQLLLPPLLAFILMFIVSNLLHGMG